VCRFGSHHRKRNGLMKNATLYHYCSAETFQKIIRGQSIRLSSLLLSNDSSEGSLLSKFLSELISDKAINGSIRDLMEIIRKYKGGRGFCLTPENDLLSQWCRYADDGQGLSIGFSYEYLESLENTKLKQVEYDHNEQKRIVGELFSVLKNEVNMIEHDGQTYRALGLDNWNPNHQEHEDPYGRKSKKDYVQLVLKTNIHSALMKSDIFRLKHNGFREESEWRLLDTTIQEDHFLPVSIDPAQTPIVEVTIGPTSPLSVDKVISCLKKNGFDCVHVWKSNIPYRRKRRI